MTIDNNLFSYTKIKKFENCPLSYKYEYIDKETPLFISIERYMGQIVHDILEQTYQNKKNKISIDSKSLLESYKKKWGNNLPENLFIVKRNFSKEYYYNLGYEMIEKYYDSVIKNDDSETIYLEHRFKIPLNNQYDYTGVIDRISKIGDKFYIIDYKTGSRVTYPSNDLQLQSYAIYALYKWELDKIEMCYEDLRNDCRKNSTFYETELINIKDTLVRSIKSINKTSQFEPKKSILCCWCEYNHICPDPDSAINRFRQFNKKSNKKGKELDGISVCPECDGALEYREGKYGRFMGCENFPSCHFTKDGWDK